MRLWTDVSRSHALFSCNTDWGLLPGKELYIIYRVERSSQSNSNDEPLGPGMPAHVFAHMLGGLYVNTGQKHGGRQRN